MVCAGRGGRRGASRPCPDKGAVPEGAQEEPPAPGWPFSAALPGVLLPPGCNAFLFLLRGGSKHCALSPIVPACPCRGGPVTSLGTRSCVLGSPSFALFPPGWRVALGGCHRGRLLRGWGQPYGQIQAPRGGSGWENSVILLGFFPCSWGEVIPLPR